MDSRVRGNDIVNQFFHKTLGSLLDTACVLLLERARPAHRYHLPARPAPSLGPGSGPDQTLRPPHAPYSRIPFPSMPGPPRERGDHTSPVRRTWEAAPDEYSGC